VGDIAVILMAETSSLAGDWAMEQRILRETGLMSQERLE
jgi:hypothetical protein